MKAIKENGKAAENSPIMLLRVFSKTERAPANFFRCKRVADWLDLVELWWGTELHQYSGSILGSANFAQNMLMNISEIWGYTET